MNPSTRPGTIFDSCWQPDDRDRIDRELAGFFLAHRSEFPSRGRLGVLTDRMSAFVLHGGKRIRPRLCLASYRIIDGPVRKIPSSIQRVAASLELLHAFMLIHDDLIDNSLLRRDQVALHEALRWDQDDPSSPAARKAGVDLALVAGDVLFALALRMLGQAGLEPALFAQVHALVTEILVETGLGQALDVMADGADLERLTEEEILQTYVRKTARYSVSGPLVLGATLAQADPAVCRSLDRFGELLGLAYQIRNDLDPMHVPPHEGDHPDLDGGKRTLLLWKAYQRLSPGGRQVLRATLAEPAGLARRTRLHALIHESGAVEECEADVRSLVRQALSALDLAPLTSAQRDAFLALSSRLPGAAALLPTTTGPALVEAGGLATLADPIGANGHV